jgi:anaerobic magnesium-protoporphyrin IX monomethyl ester cyclase
MKKLNVSLVNPPPVRGKDFIREGRCMQSADSWAAIWPPITLATLASITRKYGEAQLIDCIAEKIDKKALIERLRDFKPDIVVISAAFPSIDGDREAAYAIKRAFPSALILGFGVFFTLLEEKSLAFCEEFDAAISGEPEATYDVFLQEYMRNSEVPHIEGMIWREKESIKMGQPRELIENLDSLPYPARDLLNNELYVLPDTGEPFTLVNSARGCPYPCIFCIAPAYYGRKVRRHSVDYILDEIQACQMDLQINNFLFWEEMFTMDRDFCMKLCNGIINRELNIKWAATTRADHIDKEILAKMKESHCMLLGLGIESGSEKILKNAKKGETLNSITKAVRLCKEAGIPTMGHFIFGLPGETKETIEKTINFALKLGLNYMQAYCAVPYPKTEFGQMAKKNKWLAPSTWREYDFGGRSIINLDNLSSQDIDRAKGRLFRAFYFRPGYALRQIGKLKSPKRILNALNFLKWMGKSR